MTAWTRSTFCNFGDCVEVAIHSNGYVHVRNSRHPEQGTQVFTPQEWGAFVLGVKSGEFDLPEKP